METVTVTTSYNGFVTGRTDDNPDGLFVTVKGIETTPGQMVKLTGRYTSRGTFAAQTVEVIAPETITWAEMEAAGIDTDRVKQIENSYGSHIPTWQATAADGESAIVFGICLDVQHIIPEGEHTGWDACTFGVGEDGELLGGHSQEYYEPEDFARLLADVARFVPLKG